MSYGPTQRLVVEQLDVEECTDLLARGGVGRLGFVRGDDVIVLPVNYVFDRGSVLFRTSAGSKFDAALHRSRVAFEIDSGEHDAPPWSVLVNGVAQEVWDPVELERIRGLPLWSLTTHTEGAVVRIAPASISGRRFSHIPTATTLWVDQ